jgi:hypothetical protein
MNSNLPRHNDPVERDRLEDYSSQLRSSGNFGPSISDYLYLIESNRGGFYKIGITSDPDRRMRELQPRQILALVEVSNARTVEKDLHAEYAHARLAGTEYFELDEDEIAEIISTMEFGSAPADTSFRLVPTTVKEGIKYALEYQRRHSKFWAIAAYKAAHDIYAEPDPVEATKLELRYTEAFEDLQEYIDACWTFRSFAYDGPIEGVLKASQLICAYHQYRIDKGIDQADDDLEPREWHECLLRVQEWKKAGLSPSEMMKRSHEIDNQKTEDTLFQISNSISNQAAYADSIPRPSDNTSRSFTDRPSRRMRLSSSDASLRRANALRRWREKAAD